jgi:transcriptional regulator with XRE-family HTH domain
MDVLSALTKRLGVKIKEFRKKRNMTQGVLAQRARLSVDTIRRLERGSFSPTLETLFRVCDGLNISLHTMCEGLESQRTDLVKMIADLVASRSEREARLVWRVIRAIFEDEK